MGWLVRDGALPFGETPDSYLRAMYVQPDGSRKVLASAFVGKTWYAALYVRYVPSDWLPDGAEFVAALVVLTCGTAARGFGYKGMSEVSGPYEADCPDRIMALLSPVEAIPEASYAADWRARVAARKIERARERAAAKIAPGARIRFAEPIRFTGGVQASEFVALPQRPGGRGRAFHAVIGGEVCERVRYRIPARMLAQAEVVL